MSDGAPHDESEKADECANGSISLRKGCQGRNVPPGALGRSLTNGDRGAGAYAPAPFAYGGDARFVA